MDSREAIALQNQILELRRDVQALRDQLVRGGPTAPRSSSRSDSGGSDLTAQLLDRVQTLEDQVRLMRGRVDEIGNQVTRQGEDLAKQIADLRFATQGSSGSAAPPSGGSPTSPPPSSLGTVPAPPIVPPGPGPRTPERALQDGNTALGRGDYATAEASAREVLNSGRNTPRATDAQFLLAQAQAGQRNYQQAAVSYYDVYSRSHAGSRAPDALLGVASSLMALNDPRAACEALDKLRAEFPNARPDVRSSAERVRARANCR